MKKSIKKRTKSMIKEINKQAAHGITLVALVITIIILIILAGISLKFVLGDDGIMNIAVSAREQTTIESIRERLELVKSSAYIEGKGRTNISKYFEQLAEEKIEPYNVTNKEEMSDYVGIVEVNKKYSYLITLAENGDLQIEYEGKVGEKDRTEGTVSITIEGEEMQKEMPIKLTATITNSKEEVKNAKWSLKESEEELGIEDNSYTQTTNTNTINLELNEAKTYYLHVLTIDAYGRKVETIKGPIKITENYHTHTGTRETGGGCYTNPIYHEHVGDSSIGTGCYSQEITTTKQEPYTVTYAVSCRSEGHNVWKGSQFAPSKPALANNDVCRTCNHWCSGSCVTKQRTEYRNVTVTTHGLGCKFAAYESGQKVEGNITEYELTCGMNESIIDGYIITY